MKDQGFFFLRRKQNYPITSHARTVPCKECNQIRLYAERQPESRFLVMKFGRDVTVDDGGNYVTFHDLNFRIKILIFKRNKISYNPGTEPTMNRAISVVSNLLRTFALIVSAHPYCARKFTCHVMHQARALSTKMNNDRKDGHCYGFDWI